MKKALKIIGIILGSILLILLLFALINAINEKSLEKYVDSFGAVDMPDQLLPATDEDGVTYFTTDGEFKIVQLTDVHIGGGIFSRAEDKKAMNAVAAMISAEKPDLVVVTGDISFPVPYISGTINNAYAHRLFIRLMENLGVYWTVSFGNHDSEAYNYHGRQWVGDLYADPSHKYCLMADDGELSGVGNHVINIKNTDGLVTESLYMIDTHAYTDDDPLGIKWDYDYVKEDQIAWYAACVDKYAKENARLIDAMSSEDAQKFDHLRTPKSLCFFHIPLREVKLAYDEYVAAGRKDTDDVSYAEGHDGESGKVVYCSETDELLFETILEKGSTTALFFGHDHLNNLVLEYKGITLSYGYSIDYLAYSGIDKLGYQRGCTVITCSPDGEATIVHENYYQDKYPSQNEKETVNMEKYKDS